MWVKSGKHCKWNSRQCPCCMKTVGSTLSWTEHEKLWNGGVGVLNWVVLLKAEQTLPMTRPRGEAMAEYGKHGKSGGNYRQRTWVCCCGWIHPEQCVKQRMLWWQDNLILVLITQELIFYSRTNYFQKLPSAFGSSLIVFLCFLYREIKTTGLNYWVVSTMNSSAPVTLMDYQNLIGDGHLPTSSP